MKRILRDVSVAAALVGFPLSLAAQRGAAGQVELGAYTSFAKYDAASIGLDQKLGAGGRLGLFVSHLLSVEANGDYTVTHQSAGGSTVNVARIGGTALANVRLGGAGTAFVGAGYEKVFYRGALAFDDMGPHAVLGDRLPLGKRTALRLEVRGAYFPNTNAPGATGKPLNLSATVGLSIFSFGGAPRSRAGARQPELPPVIPPAPPVAVTPPVVAGVVVTPAAVALRPGENTQLSAITVSERGDTLTGRTVTWVSSDTLLVRVNSNGTVFAMALGAGTITAAAEEHQGTAAVTVRFPVAAVVVAPDTGTLRVRATRQFSATVTDSAGAVLAASPVAWITSRPAVAIVDSAGMLRGLVADTVTVIATSGGRAGAAHLTITPAALCPTPPPGTRVDAVGCPILFEVIEGKARPLVLKGVIFESGRSILTPQSFEVLDEVAGSLVAHPQIRIEIAGHTDSTGVRQRNIVLSLARAQAVRAYLARKGVAPARMVAKGYGPDRPVASNKTPPGRARNRRVELSPLP